MSWKKLAAFAIFGICAMTGLANAAEVDAEAKRLFALNMYHEARSEGREGMVAIGWVVLNRVADPKYPDTITGVITQKRGRHCEWGWWCDGKSDKPTEPKMWEMAQSLTDEMLGANPPADPTGGALWFQESFRKRPGWMGSDVRETTTIGRHNFFGRN
ncbi:MAG: cell wall hydrolase [Geminicoccaceae bacterium]|nr:cell wall hydrolase [Geminicoccaceae bacterium]MCB9942334.1 cell wall hydrolase [Geminicoccaceae bacterium]